MSAAQDDTFSPKNLTVLGGLLLVALILGEFVFSRHGNDTSATDEMMGVGTLDDIAMRLKPVVTLDSLLAYYARHGDVHVAQIKQTLAARS